MNNISLYSIPKNLQDLDKSPSLVYFSNSSANITSLISQNLPIAASNPYKAGKKSTNTVSSLSASHLGSSLIGLDGKFIERKRYEQNFLPSLQDYVYGGQKPDEDKHCIHPFSSLITHTMIYLYRIAERVVI